MITVLEEGAVDFESTARIATEAFGSKDVSFSAPRMKWLYERGFGQGSAIVAAFDDGKKIGQIVAQSGSSLVVHGQGGFIDVHRVRWDGGKKIAASEAGLEVGATLGG